MAFKRSSVRSRSAPPLILGDISIHYFVYVLKSLSSNRSYVGHSKDLTNRVEEHNNGKSKSTRSHRPWHLIYSEQFNTRSEAVRREIYFKSISGRKELKAKKIL